MNLTTRLKMKHENGIVHEGMDIVVRSFHSPVFVTDFSFGGFVYNFCANVSVAERNTVVRLLYKDEGIQSAITDNEGQFEFPLELGKTYVLSFRMSVPLLRAQCGSSTFMTARWNLRMTMKIDVHGCSVCRENPISHPDSQLIENGIMDSVLSSFRMFVSLLDAQYGSSTFMTAHQNLQTTTQMDAVGCSVCRHNTMSHLNDQLIEDGIVDGVRMELGKIHINHLGMLVRHSVNMGHFPFLLTGQLNLWKISVMDRIPS